MSSARQSPSLVVCSKSTWQPAIRREHGLVTEAVRAGERVVFLERPGDVRSLISGAGSARSWLGALVGRPQSFAAAGMAVRPTAAPVPGHRGSTWARLAARLLLRDLRAISGIEHATVIATTPWQWAAVRLAPAARRVFDCADDWTRLMPDRAAWLRASYATVARDADAIIVAAPPLADLFSPRPVEVVPNGAWRELVEAPPGDPQPRTLAYAGTLSERFDVPLVRRVLDELPDWTLDLYGQSQFAGRGEALSPELDELIAGSGGQVRWRGTVPRHELATRLDRAAVLTLPHRSSTVDGAVQAWRGDSMKLYDYAARGRPIVAMRCDVDLAAGHAPPLYPADDASAFAAAIRTAAAEPADLAERRRAWARRQMWDVRWRAWSAAAGHPAALASS